MTREVLDALLTGRNIQAVGVTAYPQQHCVGGLYVRAQPRRSAARAACSSHRSIYKGSADTIQTIEGMRLFNLCGERCVQRCLLLGPRQLSRRCSYVTGADSAEMGQGGVRVNMIPKDGGNTFHGTLIPGNFTHGPWQANNYNASELSGDKTFNPANTLANISVIKQIWDFNPSVGGPILRDRLWFTATFRYWGA